MDNRTRPVTATVVAYHREGHPGVPGRWRVWTERSSVLTSTGSPAEELMEKTMRDPRALGRIPAEKTLHINAAGHLVAITPVGVVSPC